MSYLVQILPGSLAEFFGLKLEDAIVRMNGQDSAGFTLQEAAAEIDKKEDTFEMTIERSAQTNMNIVTSYLHCICLQFIHLGGKAFSERLQCSISGISCSCVQCAYISPTFFLFLHEYLVSITPILSGFTGTLVFQKGTAWPKNI